MVAESEIEEVRRVYAEAERKILSRISNRLKRGKSLDISEWEQQKLTELRTMRRGIENDVIKNLQNFNDDELEKLIRKSYRQGSDQAAASLKKVLDEKVQDSLIQSDERAIRALTQEYQQSLDDTHFRILRQSEDVYRKAVREGAQFVNSGAGTRLEGSQRILNDLANRGVTGFQDSAGRNWSLSSYVEMATRTATGRAQVEGNLNRMHENDVDLVVVSAHAESCELCDPWEGEILSISGDSDEYPSVDDARGEGLFHENCTHNLTAYIEGLTETPEAEPGGEDYEDRQQQRYLERGTRKWKRRQQAAMTDKEQSKADAKVREWQSRLKEFTEEKGRRRKYEREQINQAR